jgi:UDP-N-acetylglucosamine acyltransferase
MVHPTAVIEPGAVIGANVAVGPYAVIFGNVTLGANCRVHAGAVIGDLPQDLGFQPADTYVRIGADCVIREHVTVHRGTKPGTSTEIGRECYLMANSHVGHNVRLGNRVILANNALLAGYVEVQDGAFVSGNVVIHQFVRIGRLAMLSGGSGIGKDVPPFCVTKGMQRNRIAGLNVIGMRRAGMAPAARQQVQRAFRILYQSKLNVAQALARLRAEFADGPGAEIADFVAASRRGICPLRQTEPAGGEALAGDPAPDAQEAW